MQKENQIPETQITVVNASNCEDIENATGLAGENESDISGSISTGEGIVDDEELDGQPSELASTGNDGEPTHTGTESGESDAVAITRIESERDIAIASINADIEQQRIETDAEALETIIEAKSEIELCREEIANLKTRIEAMEISSTPPPLRQEAIAETVAEEITEAVSETPLEESSILQSTATPTAEIQTEVSVENEEGEKVIVEAKARRKFIAI